MTIQLRPYQKEAVNSFLNHVRKGEKKLLAVMAVGMGKALSNDELLFTGSGFVRMGDISVGDTLYSIDGMKCNVVGVFPQGIRKVYNIFFSEGTVIKADGGHLWNVHTKSQKYRGTPIKNKTTKEIYEFYKNINKNNYLYLPSIEPLRLDESKYNKIIPPYILGTLIADGSLTKQGISYSSSDLQIVGYMEDFLLSINHRQVKVNSCDYKISTTDRKWHSNVVINELHSLGLIGTYSNTKFIPNEYLFDSYDNRVSLLRGLMDGDGYIDIEGKYASYTTVSKYLAEQVMFLVKSLGGLTSITTKIPSFTYKGEKKKGQLAYTVRVNINICPFLLKRKADRWHIPAYSTKLHIIKVEEAGFDECTCISVDSESKLFLTKDLIPTHNTTFFSYIAGLVVSKGKKVLILAHREELLQQAKERIELMNPGVLVGVEGGGSYSTGEEQVVVASVASIGRSLSERIKKFNPEEYGLLIVDETHRVVSSTYQNTLKYFGIEKGSNNHPVLLGVTATPNRFDGQDLKEVFDHVICNYDIKYGISNGYLSNIRAYTVDTGTDISEVGTSAGDFKIGELSEAVNTEQRNELIIATYRKLMDKQKVIVFCVNVEHSKNLAEEFRKAGYSSESVTGDTPKDERESILTNYKKGSLQVLCNCAVAIEGFDAPNTMGVLMARPTQSEGMYCQMLGRGVRLFEGKDHAKVIDFVDNTKNNSIVTSSSLIGLKKPIRINGENLFDYDEKFKQLLANNPFVDVSTIDLKDIDNKIHEINIFDCIHVPEDVKLFSKNGWHHYGTGYKISMGEHIETRQVPGTDITQEVKVRMMATIQENALGNFSIDFIRMTEQEPHFKNGFSRWKRQVVYTDESPVKELALKKADEIIQDKYPDKINLISQSAPWKKGGASEKQITLLKKFGFAEADKLSKGEAGNLLTYYFDQKELAKSMKKSKLSK